MRAHANAAPLASRGAELMARSGRDYTIDNYHGFVKPPGAKHDTALYRIYLAQAERIARAGGRVERVVLDFELKKSINRKLAKLSSLPQAERSQRRQEVAQEHGLRVLNGKIPLPAVRIEYETTEREMAKVEELATGHYHRDNFTRPQFLRFTGQAKGGILHRFTTKLLALGHVRATEYGRQMLVFHLYSRLVYGPID